MSELNFPLMDAGGAAAELPSASGATKGAIDLLKVNLTDVALAQFGKWREKTAEARKTLTGVQHDLSTQAKIDDAKSLRQRLINAPLAEARKVSKALKSKLNAVSTEVGAELAAIEADYVDVAKLITPQIEAREAELAAEKAAREEAEAARKKVHTDAIAKLAGYVAQAADLSAERLAKGITMLEGFDLSGFEEYTSEATDTRNRTLAALRALHVKAVAREAEEARLKAEREEQARIAAEQAEQARQLREQKEALERQRAELEAREAAAQAAREAEERRQREAAEEAERQRVAAAEAEQRRQEAAAARAELESAKATPGGAELTPAAQALHEQEGAERFAKHHPSAAGPAVIPMPTRAPAAAPTLRLGQINERLAPLSVDAAGLAALGFPHVATDKAAKLWHEHQFDAICNALIRHLTAARDQQRQAA